MSHAKNRNIHIYYIVAIVVLLAVCGIVFGEFAAVSSERSELEVRVESLSDQLEAAASRIEQVESSYNEIKSGAEQQTSEIDRLQSEVDRLKKELSDTQKKLSDAENSLDASRKREAELRKQQMSKKYPAGAKLVALTFDDGPGKYTGDLLDFIESRGVKATFFMIGSNVNRYASLLPRMVSLGCELGNHSTSHKNLKTLADSDPAAMSREIVNAQDVITRCSGGIAPTVMRPPGGNYNAALQQFAAGKGLILVNWSIDTRDWESRNVNSILKVAFESGNRSIKEGSIVLMHDIYATTVEAAKTMIDRLLDQGYTLVTVSELVEYYYGIKTPGTVYNSSTSSHAA